MDSGLIMPDLVVPDLGIMQPRELFVPGLPISQGSKRHVGGGVMIEQTAARLKPWRATIIAEVQAAGWHHIPILSGPVQLGLVFLFPRPKYHYGTGRNADRLRPNAPNWHHITPDGSKAQRAVEDALVIAGALKDDSQIAVWSGSKQYGSRPGVRITLRPISREELV